MPTETESKNLYRQDLPNGLSFDLIHVKGDSYLFGDFDHKITFPDFCIGQFPVTQALWQAVMGDNPSHFKGKNRPVESISWYDAAAFCNALNALTGYPQVYFRDEKFQEPMDYTMTRPLEYREDIDVFHNPQNPGYRLPSETQWEFAARGGGNRSTYEYAGSDKLEEVGWYDDNSHGETKPVGLKAPNELNIYDLSGNVWEWCADQWLGDSELKNIPKDGSAWVDHDKGANRVFRGGSWISDAQGCRATRRNTSSPSLRDYIIGFRVVLFPPPVSWSVHQQNP
jgi:formylglycine-generating enzyme required for sulfatase activity